MSYSIHSATGILINSYNTQESSRFLVFLSPEYGLIRVLAQGTRELGSKMRHRLLVGSVCNFEFVEGREVKRLVGVAETEFMRGIFADLPRRNAFSNVVNFVERMAVLEESNEGLYDVTLAGFKVLNDISISVLPEVVEMIMVMKILSQLGYWNQGLYTDYSEDNFKIVEANKDLIARDISKAIENTHL